jgi:hypothetical protein
MDHCSSFIFWRFVKNDHLATIHEITPKLQNQANEFRGFFVWFRGSSDWLPFSNNFFVRVMRRFILVLLTISTALQFSFPSLAQKPGTLPLTEPTTSTVSNQEDQFYTCPMHPDVMSDTPGKCPKCAMTLVRTRRPEMAEYDVKLATAPAVVKPGEKFRLSFLISHPKTGKPIKEFNIVHDMPFHLFVVSQDLTYFAHLHPQQQANGRFTIQTMVPRAGSYIIYCDVFPVGGMPQVAHRSLITAGFKGDLFSAQAQLEPDKILVKTLAGVRFELTLNPVEPVGAKPVTLKYHLTDEKTGEQIKDLQPYLGAWGHTLMLSEDASDYIHSHPTETIPDGVDRTKIYGGADVSFDAFFPRPGRYRVWSQFQRQGQLITVAFTIKVRRL